MEWNSVVFTNAVEKQIVDELGTDPGYAVIQGNTLPSVMRPDLLVQMPNGNRLAIEVKFVSKESEELHFGAIMQAASYTKSSSVDQREPIESVIVTNARVEGAAVDIANAAGIEIYSVEIDDIATGLDRMIRRIKESLPLPGS
jgi:hypothetical protein